MVLAALREVRGGGGGGGEAKGAEEGEERGEREATNNASSSAPAAPLSYSSLTPRQKEAALQLLFLRLRDAVFVPKGGVEEEERGE